MEKAPTENNSPENTLAVAAVARKHKVPQSTLQDKIAGLPSRPLSHSRQQYIPAAQENALAKHVMKLLQENFAPSVAMVRNLTTKIQTGLYPEKQHLVGKDWIPRFVEKHSELSLAWNKPISSKQAKAASEEVLSTWLADVETLHIKYDMQSSDIYNMDKKPSF